MGLGPLFVYGLNHNEWRLIDKLSHVKSLLKINIERILIFHYRKKINGK